MEKEKEKEEGKEEEKTKNDDSERLERSFLRHTINKHTEIETID